MAIENNRMYYESNYSNMACEIDAEQYAINSTYQYLKNQFPNCDYESLIVNYVNEMIQQGDYKIDFSNNKKYSSFELNTTPKTKAYIIMKHSGSNTHQIQFKYELDTSDFNSDLAE